ncbi:hypothetical protein BJ742DRAFT_502911 [Cladochytrium replicatum]|nr:hypothetical protein BJ742DRAFT_502911 [Cladochytrium replicatum]
MCSYKNSSMASPSPEPIADEGNSPNSSPEPDQNQNDPHETTATSDPLWEKCWDEESKSHYWWNTQTDETTWVDPTAIDFSRKRKIELIELNNNDDEENAEKKAKSDKEESNGTATSSSSYDASGYPSQFGSYEAYYQWYASYYGTPPAYGAEGYVGDSASTSTPALPGDVLPAGAVPLNPYVSAVAPTGDQTLAEKLGYEDYSVKGFFNPRTGKFQNVYRDARFNPEEHFNQFNKAERQMSFYFDYSAYQDQRMADRAQAAAEKPKKLTKKQVEMFKERRRLKKENALRKKYTED